MSNIDKSIFVEYLSSRGIKVKEKCEKTGMKDVMNQLKIISKFHKQASGFKVYGMAGLQDNLGKSMEKSKVDIKKLKRMIEDIKVNGPENVFEEAVLSSGKNIIEKAEKALDISYTDEYMYIIKRSMDRCEVCLGKPFFDNLFEDNCIIVSNINNCGYDLVESDGIAFFRKLIRKGYELDLEQLIGEFCYQEELESFSRDYILSLMLYPYNAIKYCMRYRSQKQNINAQEYAVRFEKACNFDEYKMRL